MKIPAVVVLDFETLPIKKRPDYPPKPVSMSVQMPGWDKPKFFAWGHLTGNNPHTLADAKRVIEEVRACGLPVLCHNARFDTDVAETHLGVKQWAWHEVHDTQFLLFLVDPYAKSLGLKQQAEKRMGIAPDERDAVKDWLLTHKAQLERNFPEIVEMGGIKPSTASAFIAYAPAEVVGPYADGDVFRTLKLFEDTYREVAERDMLVPYDRERKLSPILLRNEREGIFVDLSRLHKLDEQMQDSTAKVEAWMRHKIGAEKLNFDSGDDVVEALKFSGLGSDFVKTKGGKDSRSVESIEQAVSDVQLKTAMQYRTRLVNQHRNFIKGWLGQASRTGGTIHTVWNQVRNGDADLGGARTGRLSTDNPNILAVTKKLGRKAKGAQHPNFIDGLVELPWLRSLLLPDEGCVWVRRDISQQEYRLVAHASEGALYDAYRRDRSTDVHKFVDEQIKTILGLDLGRDTVKTLNFGMLFGMGIPGLMKKTFKTYEECQQLKVAHGAALPEVKSFDEQLKRMGKRGEYILTWGGRQYFAEAPRQVVDPATGYTKTRTFEYKLLNNYTQGGGADMTKEILIRYDACPGRTARLLAPIHDEINVSAKRGTEKEQAAVLREVIESIELDVPVLSECEMGPSWGEVTEYRDEAR